MLRELIAWVLNNYLGKYVENLNTAQLTIALLSGQVELENLPLRKDTFRYLGLPLQLISGSIGRVKLIVPVRQFRTAPWCLNIDDVKVVCGPVDLNDWDAEVEQQTALDFKLAALDRLEAKWRAQRETPVTEGSYYVSSYSGWLSYGTSLMTNIVENLQLQINGIHIRYEDNITIPHQRFACGINIEALSAQSCDSNWVAGQTSNWNQQQVTFKLVELTNFAIYWDPEGREEQVYIINPISAKAQLKRDRSETPLRTRSRPRLVCDLIWNEIKVTLSDIQYNQMMQCARGLDDIERYRRFKLNRPDYTVHENPKAWWLYAVRCHGLLRRTQCDPVVKAKENIQYVNTYSRVIADPNEVLSSENKNFTDRIERERDFDELKLLRDMCMMRMPSLDTKPPMNQGKSMLVHFFPQWWGWYNNNNTSSTEPPTTTLEQNDNSSEQNCDQEQDLSPDSSIQDDILNALADSVDTNSLLKRDAVFGKFNFLLKRGTIDFCSALEMNPKLQFQFLNLKLDVETRPRSGSHYLSLSLGTICIKDRLTPNSQFPDLVKPQAAEELTISTKGLSSRARSQSLQQSVSEPIFEVQYEKKPLSFDTDYRLMVKSQSLDIVYNPDAVKWLIEFITKPHQQYSTRQKMKDMKKSKRDLMRNWRNILESHLNTRKTWTLEFDISAPQIIFVDNFADRQNSTIVVVDFGRMQLTNGNRSPGASSSDNKTNNPEISPEVVTENDDDDAFMTPCSTPPGSEVSTTQSPTLASAFSELPELNATNTDTLDEYALYQKLYDRYNILLTDLQILVCRGKERWNFASSKGTSTLHVLDRFSISLQLERRVVYTIDPQYPSFTLSGTLPRLNAHINEYKLSTLFTLINTVMEKGSPAKSFDAPENDQSMQADATSQEPLQNDESITDTNSVYRKESANIIVFQFSIDQLSLEVQSRGRSIAELQVSGVKAGYSKRPEDVTLTLSVHGLLLADAIQSFGPDFELLVASHRHVGMDSLSGSLRQSEPCSPCSPGSPDPNVENRRPTSPLTISKALSNLQKDALITVEMIFVNGEKVGEDLQVANIQFNNLDIIANQETIAELLGFVKCAIPKTPPKPPEHNETVREHDCEPINSPEPEASGTPVAVRTEITFDFHRLNVLILRALMRDSYIVGRKVGTFTMSEARIHASLGTHVTVEGSLGGLQVLDLTPEGINHQRILSVGKDPLTDPPNIQQGPDLMTSLTQEVYGIQRKESFDELHEERQALSFCVSKDINAVIDVRIKMASVWFIHCARFMQELSWCASEFKHYLKNLVRSIRDKATDMALGLVQSRNELSNSRPESMYNSPRKTRKSRTASLSKPQDVFLHSEYTLKIDITLETPVLILPRSGSSPQVLVAHLGKITVSNTLEAQDTPTSTSQVNLITTIVKEDDSNDALYNLSDLDGIFEPFEDEPDCSRIRFAKDDSMEFIESTVQNFDVYKIDIKNINLFSLDTTNRKGFRISALPRAEEFYSCEENAFPIIHDTVFSLEISRDNSEIDCDGFKISGCVVKPLRLSLKRQQYEQLLETIDNMFKVPKDLTRPPTETSAPDKQVDVMEESTFSAYPIGDKVRRGLIYQSSIEERQSSLNLKINFELPTFIIELNDNKNESQIRISFRDFFVDFQKRNSYETNVKISLRSLMMEDLQQPDTAKNRFMVVSSSQNDQIARPTSSFASHSCPNIVGLLANTGELPNSLPNNLEDKAGFYFLTANRSLCPDTPPPSPSVQRQQQQQIGIGADETNLVIYTSVMVDPACPMFATEFNSIQQRSSIDFNSLDLIVSVESWFVLLNFFGLLNDDEAPSSQPKSSFEQIRREKTLPVGHSKLDISVRSLSLVLAKPNYEIAKANVSNAQLTVSNINQAKQVDGRLGSITLSDLTPFGFIYREKFMTTGNEALKFNYTRHEAKSIRRDLQKDALLKIEMSSVRFVHTKRFISEIQLFFKEFSQLQTPVLRKIKPTDSRTNLSQRPTQLGMEINAGAPILIFPMAFNSEKVIVADLGEFTLKNEFRMSNDRGVISVSSNATMEEVLDVMHISLFHTDIFAANRMVKPDGRTNAEQPFDGVAVDMKNYWLVKQGPSLLKESCHLELQVERNMDSWNSHFVPDISVHGKLTKLEAVMDLQQYRLVRGFLSYNLGEPLDELYLRPMYIPESNLSLNTDTDPVVEVWKNLSIQLELHDVSVRLESSDSEQKSSPLACINFIKSKLLVDCLSDGAQDIDLVSQEILIKDTRFDRPCSQSEIKNVFPNILQPIVSDPAAGQVQAEIHSRRRKDMTKFTILLNNMRLMAILDWLESAKDFILEQEDQPLIGLDLRNRSGLPIPEPTNRAPTPTEENQIELKLNITDSELVLVEKTNQSDTNAVILKSTTVVSYRPHEIAKTMSINLNNLEVFSCILGSEDNTALSIIDPVTINMDLRRGVLDVQLQKHLCLRLSYHDVKMFQRMLESLPSQTKNARSSKQISLGGETEANTAVEKLVSLGFNRTDCLESLKKCNFQIDDAALWLTQNSEPQKRDSGNAKSNLKLEAIQLKAPYISICVIDDCRDADVPFLELSLSKLDLRQEFGQCSVVAAEITELETDAAVEALSTSFSGFKTGRMIGVFASDYYNRALSGWEPLIEPWKVEAQWGYSLGQAASSQNRLNLKIESNDTLRLNITSTLIDLYQLVKSNWTQDYYNSNANSLSKSPANYRRRTPFVPFAIKNDTGVRLWYTTIVSTEVSRSVTMSDPNMQWTLVDPEGVKCFSYASIGKQRHRDTHKFNLHQIAVRVEGWQEVGPISVDRVGTYFRHARAELVDDYSQTPKARIVFAVSLEGSAQKLITVRSALKLSNKLDNPVLVKMEHLYGHLNIRNWPDTKTQILHSNEVLNIPLTHVHAILYFRPLAPSVSLLEDIHTKEPRSEDLNNSSEGWTLLQNFNIQKSNHNNLQFTDKGVRWNDAMENGEVYQELRTCRGNREKSYRMLVTIRKEGFPCKDVVLLPGHLITLLPPLRIHNLLPCDLLYKLSSGTQGRIASSEAAKITEVDMEQQVTLTITLDSYPGAGQIIIPAGFYGSTEMDIKLFDTKIRMLKLKAFIIVVKGRGIQISISVPFWLVNRTGLPLVFRQDDLDCECAGQFSENEEARMISPFMFAFLDPSSSGSVTMRLGKRFGQALSWCQPFKLEQGTKHRQLVGSNESFVIGIDIRRARGRYNQTSVVTFSPRYQLYNRSSYKLQVIQKCFTDTVHDPVAKSAFIEAVPGCHIAFHWPRLDKEQKLCVRLPEVPDCIWSAGVPIYETQSLYINIRTVNGAMNFLRLETLMQGATYFMIFSDPQSLPPPVRIDNFSEVPIKFHQAAIKHQFKTTVRPRSSIAYVLDDPLESRYLQFEAPGGDYENCSLNGFDNFRLTYENFIYIAFSQTFEVTPSFEFGPLNDFDVKSQQLVLGVVDSRVMLVRKQAGDRSQLWRMNNEKQLEHEGSSPPSEPGKKQARFVLDLERALQPMQFIGLVVRPANKLRKSTQTWRFTEEGRLMCEHSNMCVQAKDGIFGLRAGNDAVLGMCVSDTKALNRYGVPYDQAVSRQKLRSGSGCLTVGFRMDGPIKCIQIKDIANLSGGTLALDPSWKHVSHIMNNHSGRKSFEELTKNAKEQNEYYVVLKLRKGVGLSLISNHPCEELAYISLEDINMELISTPTVVSVDFSVGDMQIDNQLFETSCPITLYTINPPSLSDSPRKASLSSLQLNAKLLPSPNTNAIIFEHFIVSVRPIAVYLEERLILRLFKFAGLAKTTTSVTVLPDESEYEAQKIVYKVLDANVKRYYFGDLQIVPSQIRLSFITTSKLTPEFAEIKRNLGFTFIKFEDAILNFEKFTHKYHFETMDAYLNAIKSHYKQELKWQAASILGSVDFLGNPLGFANDLTEGVSGLLLEGSISSLVKNVTHGISNSTAKLTETISDGLGKVVFDEEHVETRQKILDVSGGSGSTTGDHLVAGFKGFTFGLLGGMTSVVKHTYQGTVNDGLSGFLTGLGKGLVGTVTKPVIGVLDLASETANAVREQSKSSSRILPERKRHPRVVTGAPGGLLPPFSSLQSKGQQYLYLINKRNFSEHCMAYEPCLMDSKDSKMRLLISDENVWGFSKDDDTTTIVFHYRLSEIISCHPVVNPPPTMSEPNPRIKRTTYIEFCLSLPSKSLTPSAPEMVKRPRVRCQNEETAKKICHHINFAKCIYDEREQTLNLNAVIDS
ncbi:intermembrane lipid transfer protein Vps13D isoform X3 [Toxorhynchites rutilus septentrionalis]|uniref:intermembrane lipid transfer protein Vps13D isoform X3 n=1 Tax=Toxorhynchites rutilus septentrionalis TaxID=329112 RepID=UPI0024784F92|nr:intermembrane lipid transfer protein Vps13D isoform X3 [Toxorhynchites rutilus septentrionalis]